MGDPNLRLVIEGHTCTSARFINPRWRRRANAVRDYLSSRHRGGTIGTVSMARSGRFDNSREETRRLNRRAAPDREPAEAATPVSRAARVLRSSPNGGARRVNDRVQRQAPPRLNCPGLPTTRITRHLRRETAIARLAIVGGPAGNR